MTIRSHIDGDFNGTNNETLFKLVNGQIWQQIGYKYRYHYRFRPRVTIEGSSSRATMMVDGFRDPIQVRRLA